MQTTCITSNQMHYRRGNRFHGFSRVVSVIDKIAQTPLFSSKMVSFLLTLSADVREGYYSCCHMCLCVCVSIFSILPSHTFKRPTRGISSYSAENAVKLKSCFI